MKRWLAAAVAVLWAALAVWLVVRGVRAQGVADYLDGGNVSGALLGLVLPGAFVALVHHRAQVQMHQETRDLMHKHHLRHLHHLRAMHAQLGHDVPQDLMDDIEDSSRESKS